MQRKRIKATGAEADVHSRWRRILYRGGDREVSYVKRSTNRRERREARAEITEMIEDYEDLRESVWYFPHVDPDNLTL